MPFTPEQESAIIAENRELLISAAAGSGKTAVLVERICYLITKKHFSIDRMLVVTYTRAAAAELRERLELRLQEAAQSDPPMQEQVSLLSNAQISTIHSFCQKLLKENFRYCGIDPQFSLGDERTIATMYQECMEDILEEIYTQAKTDPELNAFLKIMPEQNAADVLDKVYHFLTSRPDPKKWLEEQAAKTWTMEGLEKEPVALSFIKEAKLLLMGVMNQWSQTKELSLQPAFPEPLKKTIAADLVTISDLVEDAEKGYCELQKSLNQCKFVTLARTKPNTEDEAALAEEYKEIRNSYKKSIDSMRKLLPGDIISAIEDMNAMIPALKGVVKAVKMLQEAFQKQKLQQSLLDFNDLEHMTLQLLKEPELRKMISARYDAVFVDEYQDVSAIQETILNGIKRTKDEPLQFFFYVGDVKQSIYRFRLAEPKLFLSKLSSFSPEETAEHRKIILNKNFRSREGVLDAVNRTFAHVMDSRVTEIDYNRDAMLYPGIPSENDPITELHVISSDKSPKDVILAEAELIAQDILRTVSPVSVLQSEQNSAGVKYRDIAILMPVVKNVADKVEMVLSKHGIPVYTDASANAFAGEEVTQAVQHLQLLDNLMNDVALLSELRSPLFQLTEGELTEIRLSKPERNASFLSAVQHMAETENGSELNEKCKQILETMEKERFLYRSMSPDEYLWSFLMRSGLYAHYGTQPGGKLRQANLRMLCTKVGEYADSHRDGLQGLLESIQAKTGSDSSSPTVVNPWENVVRIMSIHKSKGLEFPTVYLMGLGNSIAHRRQTKLLSLHGDLGLGLMYRNEKARTKRTTLMQNGIDLQIAAEQRAEKARVLYVAMTRPKNRLMMIGTLKSKKLGLESTSEIIVPKSNEINDILGVRNAGSMLEWLLQCLNPEDEIQTTNTLSTNLMWERSEKKELSTESTFFPQKNRDWRVVFHIDTKNSVWNEPKEKTDESFLSSLPNPWKKSTEAITETAETNDPLSPLPAFIHEPTKIGVTALCRTLAEQEKTEAFPQQEEETVETKRLPIQVQKPRLLNGLAQVPTFLAPPAENLAALKGTVTHRLLSLLSLKGLNHSIEENTLPKYLQEQLQQMIQSGIFTQEEGKQVDLKMVEGFLTSAIGKRMQASPEVHREWSFNLRIHQPINTLVQGVIDLCFMENGQWILMDFKTDRVQTVQELWPRYSRQLAFYRSALEKSTGIPVTELGLFALRLGKADLRRPDFDTEI